MRSVLPACLLVILISACASDPPVSTLPQFERAVMPLDEETRAKVDRLAISSIRGLPGGQDGLVMSPDSSNDFQNLFAIADPGPAGGNIVGAGIGLLVIVVGAPIIAVKNAFAGVDEEEVKQASASIGPILLDPAWSGRIQNSLSAKLRAAGRDIVAPANTTKEIPATLILIVDGPMLEILERNGQPQLIVHGQMQTGTTCLADRYWAWNGKQEDFFDLAEEDGKLLKEMISEGTDKLGAAIAEDLFLSEAPRKVAYYAGDYSIKARPMMLKFPEKYWNTVAVWPGDTPEFGSGIPCGAPDQKPDHSTASGMAGR